MKKKITEQILTLKYGVFFLFSSKVFILLKGCVGVKQVPKAAHVANLGECILSTSCIHVSV